MLYMPVRIFFGAGALVEAGDQLAQLGSRALIVCGNSSAHKSGVMAELLPLLDAKGLKHSVYAGISENPSTDQVIRGKEQFIAESCDFTIGIGGGSPLDAAKAISLAAANDLSLDQLYESSLRQKAFPIVAIPTTHGTGSEVTQYSVLTDRASQRKAGFGNDLIFPKIAIIDPRYMTSLSPKVSLNTTIDALSHLLEGIYSTKRNPLLFPMIFRSIRMIRENLSLCLKEPEHLPAREALALASMYGGITIAHGSTTLQHSIGYPFTTEYGIPHGLANGMFMEAIMRFYAPSLETELDALFAYLDCSMQDFWDWLDEFPIKVKVPADDLLLKSWIPQILSARNTAISPIQPNESELLAILKTAQGDRI